MAIEKDFDYNILKASLHNKNTQILGNIFKPRINKYMKEKPLPKQAIAMMLPQKELMYGGAASGGKSSYLLMDCLQYVDIKGYSAIIFRKTYADLVKPGALIDRAKEWLMPFDEVHWNDKEKKFTWYDYFSKGRKEVISTLQFGYLDTEQAKERYQGGEYQMIAFDEITHISESNYKYLFSRVRKSKNSIIPLKVRSTSNPPDGTGEWVRERFVDPKTKRKHAIFLPSGIDDNPFIDKESYEEMLNELDPVTRAKLKDGDWSIKREGNMFKRDWFEFVDEVPQFRRKCRFWDMASTDDKIAKKKNKDPDFTVGALVSESKGIFYIEDIVRVRKRSEETEKIQAFTAISDGFNVRIREEQEPGSSGQYTIDNKARTIFKGKNYKGIRSTGSKVERANAFSAACERGQVKILRGCRNIEEFFNEAEMFPAKGYKIHDDIVDATSGAFKELGISSTIMLPSESITTTESYWLDNDTENFNYFNNYNNSWRI